MKIFHSFIDLIGHTPIVQLHQIEEKYNLKARLLARLMRTSPPILKIWASTISENGMIWPLRISPRATLMICTLPTDM